ncbi:unnamed protein product [Macrosiphum euphorbiae]|uniref:Uncharacterized protein n=1 Tax=Macrosiphum euphorbiae TaxID=13131 RepID=A0AAV0X4L6_9HEMI|nr:unnamed protein product [Macrosiphum euphorbiae]
MIRQICGREPPERFKRQTAHGGQFVLFPLFPPAPGQARPGNTRFAERNISLQEKSYGPYVAVAALTSNKKVRFDGTARDHCIEYTYTCEDAMRGKSGGEGQRLIVGRRTVENRFESSVKLSK